MLRKNLYVLISNGGDGSYYPRYTFDSDLITTLKKADRAGKLNYDSPGCDGDGFHYDTLSVLAQATYQQLGIAHPLQASDFEELLED